MEALDLRPHRPGRDRGPRRIRPRSPSATASTRAGPSATTTPGAPGSDRATTATKETPMASWADFAAAAPDIAAEGRRLILARGDGEALLATVRGDDLPRIHPVNVAIVDGRLYAFIIARSPKRLDLELDGRFAMHTHQDPTAPSEVALRGHARLVTRPTRARGRRGRLGVRGRRRLRAVRIRHRDRAPRRPPDARTTGRRATRHGRTRRWRSPDPAPAQAPPCTPGVHCPGDRECKESRAPRDAA